MPYFGHGVEAQFRQLVIVDSADVDEERSPHSPGSIEALDAVTSRTVARMQHGKKVLLPGVLVVAAVTMVVLHFHPVRVSTWRLDSTGVQRLDDESGACSEAEDDCRDSTCCMTPGHTCYAKNEWWAVCMEKCLPGQPQPNDDTPEAWSCEELGDKTPMPLTCTWAGEDCSGTLECCQRGFTCMIKEIDVWTACAQEEQGPWEADGITPKAKVPPPKGWEGTKLGGWRQEFAVEPTAKAAKNDVSLFCFMAILTGSSEEELVDLAWERKAGIFGCEDNRIYHSGKSDFKLWDTGENTLQNTATFVEIWKHVKVEGKYRKQDWTIKADADCIFFPARLRAHLKALNAPANKPLYVKNTMPRYTNGGFLGAIEVFTREAVTKFVGHADECSKHIGMNSGEDGFLKDCMDALGIGFMSDESLMHPSGLMIDCQVKEFASFHPFKTKANWTECYDFADGNSVAPQMFPGSIELLPEHIRRLYQ